MSLAKTCRGCGEKKEIQNFYRHSKASDGHCGKCKECIKSDVRDNRARKRDYYLEFDRARAWLPHRVEARAEYAKTEAWRVSHNKSSRKYTENHPEKYIAHVATGNAIRDGKLVREPCEVCSEPKTQAHHDDYSKPLEVRWLCVPHHVAWHRYNRPERLPPLRGVAAMIA